MARLDRLASSKAVAQLGAVVGRTFAYDVLQAVAPWDEPTLQQGVCRLVEAGLLYQRGVPPQATYRFKHALIQETAYQSLLTSTRQHSHRQIAQTLETRFPETAAAQPELLAHHYTAAGRNAQAVGYWQHAGQRASERSAHVEALAHLRQGLALLKTLPETVARTQREVDLLIALGASLLAVKGYAAREVGEAYQSARHLCQPLADPQRLFPVLRGLWNYANTRAEYQTAQALGEQLLALAHHAQDAAMLVAAHRALGATLFWMGRAAAAHTHVTQGIALYDAQQHRPYAWRYGEDTGVMCHGFAARTLWYLGSPAQGLARSQAAVSLAQQSTHPFSLGHALHAATSVHQYRREVRLTQERADALISLATDQGFPQWQAGGALLRGWALAQQGQVNAGIAQMQQSLQAFRATGAEISRPYYLALLAEAYGLRGQPEAGLTALTEALTLTETTGERWYQAELLRLQGALLLQGSSAHAPAAETCFRHAIAIAHNQQAKALELRATTSLARLWQQQGKRREAYALLAPVCSWFTEGFDTPDWQEAQALLNALAG